MDELISIIIPIYNTERYLKRCIKSIIEQSYRNIEVILVNDGSVEKNVEYICQEFIKKDNRVKYYRKSNRGVSDARNFGLRHCTGKYVVFVDSDDWIEKEMIKELKLHIEGNDLVACSYKRTDYRQKAKYIRKYANKNFTLNKKQFLNILFLNGNYKLDYQGFIFNKLFKVEIINKYKIRFNKNIYYNEDRLFIFEYLLHSKKNIYFLKYMGYNYYQRQGSMMNQNEYNEKMYTEFLAFDEMSKLAIGNKYKKIDDLIRNEYVIHSLNICIKYNYLQSIVEKYKNNANKYIIRILFNKDIKIKSKLSIIKNYLKIFFYKR